jgi:hypothetical protein
MRKKIWRCIRGDNLCLKRDEESRTGKKIQRCIQGGNHNMSNKLCKGETCPVRCWNRVALRCWNSRQHSSLPQQQLKGQAFASAKGGTVCYPALRRCSVSPRVEFVCQRVVLCVLGRDSGGPVLLANDAGGGLRSLSYTFPSQCSLKSCWSKVQQAMVLYLWWSLANCCRVPWWGGAKQR